MLGEEEDEKKGEVGSFGCCRWSDARIHKKSKNFFLSFFWRVGVILRPNVSSKDIKGSRRTPRTRTINCN